ncbi:MAG: hypothetical protein AAGE52_32955 [Myxococcota bacterium]
MSALLDYDPDRGGAEWSEESGEVHLTEFNGPVRCGVVSPDCPPPPASRSITQRVLRFVEDRFEEVSTTLHTEYTG